MKAMTLSARSSTDSNSPRRSRRRSKIEKNNPYLVLPTGMGRRVMDVHPWVGLQERDYLVRLVGGKVVSDAVEVEVFRGEPHQVAEEFDEVVAPGRVGHPTGDVALVHVEGSEQDGRPVALVLELASSGLAGNGRLGGIDPGLRL